MNAGGDSPSPGAPPGTATTLAELVAAALERLEAEGPPALAALCAEHPAHATALRARVEQLRAIGFVGAVSADAPLPERIGGFRILSRLGGGGMGVVFLAQQEGLQRQVALKLVRPDLLHFSGARERFAREVDAVARLAHPGIVPVFAGGEDNGIPYYAMELVRGASLEEVLAALAGRDPSRLSGADLSRTVDELVQRREAGPTPTEGTRSSRSSTTAAGGALFAGTWTSACLRIAQAVALALQHAHERGVLHRDIKPSNIMLTPHGRVLLLDFGLAAAEGSERLTGSGAQMGSLAWMSPEQVRGAHATLDGRADVYSLGATLYELLSLRSPFTGGDAETTRQRILDGRAIPLRDLNAAVPRDAETVCLRAMACERERRYPDAAAFADDLDNALQRRPVSARRPGPAYRMRRWVTLHPAAAVGLAAGLLLCIGGPLAYAWQQHEATLRITEAYDEAAAQRAHAEANFTRAKSAVDVLLTQVAEEGLLHVPNLEPVRRRLLESALAFYEDFLAERTDDPALKRLVVQSCDRCGYLLIELGRHAEACDVFTRQATLAGELVATAPEDDELLDMLGNGLAGRAFSLSELGRLDEARTALAESLAVRRERVRLSPRDWNALRDVDEALGQMSVLEFSAGRLDAALEADRACVEFVTGILDVVTSEEQHVAAIASIVAALSTQASHLKTAGRADEAATVVEHAIELSAPYLLQMSADAEQAIGAANVRELLLDGVPPEVTEVRLREALDIVDRALEHSAQHVVLRRLRANGLNNLGTLLLDGPGREAEARALLVQSIDEMRRLLGDAPDAPMHQALLAGSLVNLGSIERAAGDSESALARFTEALQRATEASGVLPADGTVRNALFNAAWFLGLTNLERLDGAGCAAAADALVRLMADDARALRIAAGLHARAAALGTPEQADAWRAAGLHALRLAVTAGLNNVSNLENATDLDELRSFPEFDELVERARANLPGEP